MALLLVPVGLLGWEAARATLDHRATAEGVLSDYAILAADRLAAGMDRSWQELLYAPIMMMREAAKNPKPWLPARKDISPERYPEYQRTWEFIRTFHRYDPSTEELRVSEQGVDGSHRAWVKSVLARIATDLAVDERRTVFEIAPDGRVRPIFATRFKKPDGAPGVVYAVEGRVAAVIGMLREIGSVPLLPAVLLSLDDQDGLVGMSIRIPGGRTLMRRGDLERAAASATRRTGPGCGLEVTASIAPSAADDLVIGGLPASRLPLVLLLFVLTLILASVAVFLVRREAQLARLRSDFVASVSHELRTPLAQIRMFAETLVLGRVRNSDEARRSIRIIDQEARRLSHQVENVLQFARAERGGLKLELESADPRGIVEETVEGFRPLAAAREVEVLTDLQSTPAVRVDREGLRRVLINLLDNALKYGPKGETVLVQLDAFHDHVRLMVDDAGPGIATRDRDRVFEKYRRGQGPRHAAVGGCGIGLWLVKELVAAFGGDVRIGRAGLGGTRVEIDLPTESGDPAIGAPSVEVRA